MRGGNHGSRRRTLLLLLAFNLDPRQPRIRDGPPSLLQDTYVSGLDAGSV